MFTRTGKNARNKEYASLFMEAHGVHMAKWHDSLSFILWVDDSVCHVSGRVRDFDHESMTSL